MAFSRTFIASLLLSLLLLHLIEAHTLMMGSNNGTSNPLPHPIDCGVACSGRCELSSRPRLCKRACGSCCVKCQCVPPGTAGNREACPCYANLTTRSHLPKCP